MHGVREKRLAILQEQYDKLKAKNFHETDIEKFLQSYMMKWFGLSENTRRDYLKTVRALQEFT